MIFLSRLDGEQIVVNAELIEHPEAKPDTMITLVDGTKYEVAEKPPGSRKQSSDIQSFTSRSWRDSKSNAELSYARSCLLSRQRKFAHREGQK